MRLLIVDDDIAIRSSLNELFKRKHDVCVCEDGESALNQMKKASFDVVITDHKMPGVTGIELIKQAKDAYPSTIFLLMTAYASVQQAVEAIKIGAEDYIMKPFDILEMEHRVSRLEKIRELKFQNVLNLESARGTDRLIGNSEHVQSSKKFIDKISDVSSSVLLFGPSGVGKEVMAKAIHESGPRAKHAFVAINCATLNEQLIESELFGHEKGAFTGAQEAKPGKFELASEGTIFLDEIGELPIELQAKLLRVLQEKEFCRVGGVRNIKTNARTIVATNRDLKKMVSEGTFREDLYFRLNVLAFELLPLKNRKDDIPLMIDFFWNALSKELRRKSSLDSSVAETICAYSFPGNIRELKNILERLIVLGPKSGIINQDLLPQEIKTIKAHGTKTMTSDNNSNFSWNIDFELGLTEQMEQIEEFIIKKAMEKNKNNQVKAANMLKIKRGTLQYKLKKIEEKE